MESIDILTADGEQTGTHAERSIIHSKGLWHRTVHVWIRNRAGELLLQKRSLNKETHPGLWDISSAGHLSAGDSSSEGAVREVREELGIIIDAKKLQYLFSLKQHWETPDGSIIENEIKDVYLYTTPVEIEDIRIDSKEVSDICSFNVENLKNQLLTNKDQFVPHEEEYRRLFGILNK